MIAYIGFATTTMIAGIIDIKTLTIPNKISIPLALAGLIYHTYIGMWRMSIVGFLVAFAVGYVCFALGGMGGGDVKLMAAIGAWCGVEGYIFILLIASVIALIWTFVVAIKHGALINFLKQIRDMFVSLKMYGLQALFQNQSKEKPSREPIPFGFCLGIASICWTIVMKGLV